MANQRLINAFPPSLQGPPCPALLVIHVGSSNHKNQVTLEKI